MAASMTLSPAETKALLALDASYEGRLDRSTADVLPIFRASSTRARVARAKPAKKAASPSA